MKKLFGLTVISLIASSTYADLSVSCKILSKGRNTGTCETRVSGVNKTGEIKLKAGETYKLSNIEACELGSYDLLIENTSRELPILPGDNEEERMNRERLNAGSASTFLFTIVQNTTIKKKKQPVRIETKAKSKMGLADVDGGGMTGNLSYTMNGSGLNCTFKN